MSKKIKTFNTEQEAEDYLYETVDDPYVDNYRFAFKADKKALQKYREQQNKGCCGFYDEEVIVNNKEATIGCNYGH